jgi:hypothetical protein
MKKEFPEEHMSELRPQMNWAKGRRDYGFETAEVDTKGPGHVRAAGEPEGWEW